MTTVSGAGLGYVKAMRPAGRKPSVAPRSPRANPGVSSAQRRATSGGSSARRSATVQIDRIMHAPAPPAEVHHNGTPYSLRKIFEDLIELKLVDGRTDLRDSPSGNFTPA